ncbi:MAG: HlyD family secretion protein [Proteobacteria bacterium]|nr:HlyD family secretion protein [Pseudomonadota bacterium]
MGRESTDDAFVDGKVFAVSPRVSGYVTEVLVEDNQRVQAGQPLVLLDASEYEVARASARAALAEAEAMLASLELGVPLELTQTEQRVRGARAQLESMRKTLDMLGREEEAAAQELKRAEAENDLARSELRRMQALQRSGAVSRSALDTAETRARSAQAMAQASAARRDMAAKQRASTRADMARLEANIELAATGQEQADIRARQVEAQRARVELARSQAEQAELNRGYTTVKSPADGFVTRKQVQAGLMVSRGQPLLAVVPLDPQKLWITANFKETQLTRVRPGQRAYIRVDAFPDRKLLGKVESIMAGTGAVFSLFPPENATGNYVKVVQRIPVKIVFDEAPGNLPDLRVGMSALPVIFTD